MNTHLPPSASILVAPASTPIPYERFGFCWGAVLAGLTVAIALNVLFAELGLALNLGIIDRESSAGEIAVANGVAWVITGLVALFAGAWVAGRLATTRSQTEGGLHGVGVWGAGAVVMLMLAFGSAGVVGSGMLGVVGKGLEGAGAVAEVAVPTWDAIETELDDAVDGRNRSASLASADEQRPVDSGSPVGSAENQLVDRSRLYELAERHFTFDVTPLESSERDELIGLIAGQTGISKDAANRTLQQWDRVWARSVQAYESAKQQAAVAADKARRIAIAAATWAAVAMILGAAAALLGGVYGTRSRARAFEHAHLVAENSRELHRAQIRGGGSLHDVPQPLA